LSLGAAAVHLAVAGCAAHGGTGNPASMLPPARIATSSPDSMLAGVWEGTSVSDCSGMTPCTGMRWFTFTMMPASTGGLDGFYRCEQSTGACEPYNNRGLITEASVNRRLFSVNVELQDDQECIFRSLPAPVEMEGRFYCKQRAIQIDRGVWRAERTF
jgi:hypothetical protein